MYQNRIFIIGAGAVGKALAIALQRANRNVTLVRGSVDDGTNSREEIQLVQGNGEEIRSEIEVNTLSSIRHLNGIVVLSNKSFGNEVLAEKLKSKIGASPVVLLQNGLGVEKPFLRLKYKELYRCVLFITAQFDATGRVSFKPIDDSLIGPVSDSGSRTDFIVQQLNTNFFPFKKTMRIEHFVWEKTILNCVFNSICPLLETDNGIFHRNDNAFNLAKGIIQECLVIATKKGIDLDQKTIEEGVLKISKGSDGQFISTLQDIKKGKQTEIETLNLEIVKLARSSNDQQHVLRTEMLGELIGIKSGRYKF